MRDAVSADIFEHIDVGLCVYEAANGDVRLVGCNPCAKQLADLTDERFVAHVQDVYERIRSGEREVRLEPRPRETGDKVLRLRGFPLPGDHVGIELRDVTAQYHTRQALRRREHQLSESQAVCHLGSWDWNVADDTVTWSDELYRIFGLTPGEFGATFEGYLERTHPDDRAELKRIITNTVETGQPFHHVKRVVRPDGEVRYLDSRAHVVTDPLTGKAAMLYGTCHDITDRLQVERDLALHAERYRKLFEEALTGNFIATAIGQFVAVNPAFLAVFGFASRQDALEARLSDLFPSERACRAFLERVRREGTLRLYELELRTCKGEPLQTVANFVATLDEAGEITELKGYVLDVTDQRKVEQQLRHMQKMDAIGRLAGGVAHDFNNLLTIILSYVHVLRRRQGEDRTAHGALDAIAEAAESASTLTRQLLTVGRGQLVERRVVDANQIVRDAESVLRRVIGEDIALEVTCAPDPGYVEIGTGQLDQILLNLVANARDALPGGGHLSITTSVSADRVLIGVTDDGVGMPPEVQSHIFEPFFTTKGPGKGSGLGLPTVYGIVKQAGGDVGVTSEPDRGTTVQIRLPVARPRSESPAPGPTPRVHPAGGEKLLAVEDAGPLRDLIRQVLEEAGYEVSAAGTAEEALEQVERGFHPDVLLTDVILPGSNGPELVRNLRKRLPRLRAIYMSGYSRSATFSRADERGEEVPPGHYLAKPFTPDQLLRLIREVLDAPTVPPPAGGGMTEPTASR